VFEVWAGLAIRIWTERHQEIEIDRYDRKEERGERKNIEREKEEGGGEAGEKAS
jgi:hypothetical protein